MHRLPSILKVAVPILIVHPRSTISNTVFLWFLERMALSVKIEVDRRGYYPRGGAAMRVRVTPGKPRALELFERSAFKQLAVIRKNVRRSGSPSDDAVLVVKSVEDGAADD